MADCCNHLLDALVVRLVGDWKGDEHGLPTRRPTAVLPRVGFLETLPLGVVAGALDDKANLEILDVVVNRWPLPTADVELVGAWLDAHGSACSHFDLQEVGGLARFHRHGVRETLVGNPGESAQERIWMTTLRQSTKNTWVDNPDAVN